MDHATYGLLIIALWLALGLYWAVAAFNAKPVRRRETIGSRLSYAIPLFAGSFLLASHNPNNPLNQHFLPPEMRHAGYWIGFSLTAMGLAFAIWARQHLAGNWSGSVTLKENHELIRSGPYGWVRHPIYTGILVAVIGTALAGARWGGLLAIALIAAGLIRKLRFEETWLSEIFPDYAAYKAAIPALIPFIY